MNLQSPESPPSMAGAKAAKRERQEAQIANSERGQANRDERIARVRAALKLEGAGEFQKREDFIGKFKGLIDDARNKIQEYKNGSVAVNVPVKNVTEWVKLRLLGITPESRKDMTKKSELIGIDQKIEFLFSANQKFLDREIAGAWLDYNNEFYDELAEFESDVVNLSTFEKRRDDAEALYNAVVVTENESKLDVN